MTIAPTSGRRPSGGPTRSSATSTTAPASSATWAARFASAPTAAGQPTGHPGTDPTWDAAWAAALDASELDAAEVEALLARIKADPNHAPDAAAAWVRPVRLGPLPASMAVRAEAVLKRHQRLAEELTVAITENRHQRQVAAKLRQREQAAPVYIDTEA